jgi:hypothetical protein
MLPPLARSLAYSNYSQWRTSHNDQDLPEVTPGVPLSEFYKAAEQEVRAGRNLILGGSPARHRLYYEVPRHRKQVM